MPLADISAILKDVKGSVHFIGVLGSGMLPLAELLRNRGYSVSGSDRAATPKATTSFPVFRHTDISRQRVDLAVYSLAVDDSDPEIKSAATLGVPLISRAQLLGYLMSGYKTRISVSGSHGKSTVTALIDAILAEANMAHTAVSGATLSGGVRFRDGGGEIFLTEACEYKDSFLRLCPTHQLINGVELDHTDYFDSLEHIRASFMRAARMAGTVLINTDDKVASGIADELICGSYSGKVITYGTGESCDYRLMKRYRDKGVTHLAIKTPEGTQELETPLLGGFNLMNITAAIALTHSLGISGDAIYKAVKNFYGIDRRLSKIAGIDGRPVYYDYAHHPSEISAVIDALKERYGTLTVIFRPHTYSRTASLWDGFVTALSKADLTVLVDIYPAREREIQGISSQDLARAIGESAVKVDLTDAAAVAVSSPSRAIALLGAGEVDSVKDELIKYGRI